MERSLRTLYVLYEIILAKIMKTRVLGRPPIQRWAAPLLAALIAAACAVPAEAGSTAAQVSFTYGVLAFEEGDNEEAARLFAEAVQNDPDEGTFLHWLGLADLRLGRAEDAVDHLEKSLKARCAPAAGRARVRADLRRAREALAGGHGRGRSRWRRPSTARRCCASQELPLWEGRVGLASGWDSNPELVTEERCSRCRARQPGRGPLRCRGLSGCGGRLSPLLRPPGVEPGPGPLRPSVEVPGGGRSRPPRWKGRPRWAGAEIPGGSGRSAGRLPVPAGPGRIALLLQAGGSRAWLSGDLYRGTVDLAASLFVHETPRRRRGSG